MDRIDPDALLRAFLGDGKTFTHIVVQGEAKASCSCRLAFDMTAGGCMTATITDACKKHLKLLNQSASTNVSIGFGDEP